MDPELYNAAKEGNFEVLMQRKDQLEAQMTATKNSVLHVAALCNKSNVVKKILEAQPLLLCRVNIKGDTTLHIAAREGNFSTVQALIKCAKVEDGSEVKIAIGMAKYLLRMVNNDGNTALHEAVWNKDHLNIVELLLQKDPEFSHPANKDEETPLYIAAERGFDNIVSKILTTCTSPACSGPSGRNALHGAVTNWWSEVMEKYYQKISRTGESTSRSHLDRDDAPKQRRVELDLSNLEKDPGLRKHIRSYHPNDQESVRRAYLLQGPSQPKLVSFPFRDFGGKPRRFNRAWYNEFEGWLEYSTGKDVAYCLFCYLFKPDIGDQSGGDTFANVGFSNWKKKSSLNDHANSDAHYQAWRKSQDLLNQGQHIETAIHRQSQQVTEEYRLRLNAHYNKSDL